MIVACDTHTSGLIKDQLIPGVCCRLTDLSGRAIGKHIEEVVYLASGDPDMSLWCRLTKSASQVLKMLLILGAGE